MAIQWPLSLSAAQTYGESTTTNAILSDDSYWLKSESATGPSANIGTPFQLAAFVYADKKATYAAVKASDLLEIKRNDYLEVTASAFSTYLRSNNDMIVVLKQNDKTILSAYQGKPDEDVTEHPEVGYRTRREFRFPLSTFQYKQPFTIVIANAVTDGAVGKSETTWNVDPSTFR
jgi:hypothetical protein